MIRSLAFWCILAGMPALPGSGAIPVTFADLPDGIGGVACSADLFGLVEGNAQHLCAGRGDGASVTLSRRDFPGHLYASPNLRDRVFAWYSLRGSANFREVLCHEWWHLQHGAVEGDTAWDRFQEEAAYEFGRSCR